MIQLSKPIIINTEGIFVLFTIFFTIMSVMMAAFTVLVIMLTRYVSKLLLEGK